MAWTVRFDPVARKQLRKLGKVPAARVIAGLEQIAALDHPKQRGAAMVGNRTGYWRYRFGDYRAIARIEDQKVLILVVTVGHRREVYD